MENNKEFAPRAVILTADLYHTEAELERLRKTIANVNLNSLPDKGARLKRQEKELEKQFESLRIEATKGLANAESCDKSRNIREDGDVFFTKEDKNGMPNNLPGSSKDASSTSATNKDSKVSLDQNAKAKYTAKPDKELPNADHSGFSKVFKKDIVSFEKLSESVPKMKNILGDLIDSPSFKSYRQPINAAKLINARPMIEQLGKKNQQKTLFSVYNTGVLGDEETVKKLHHSLCTYPDDAEEALEPASLLTPLMQHQVKALSWLVWRESQQPSGGILADDMGLGKTLTMISLLLKQKEDKKFLSTKSEFETQGTLVVCLASILHQWNDEISKHCTDGSLNVLIYHGSKRKRDIKLMSTFDVVLTTYETLSSEQKMVKANKGDSDLFKLTWERIVLDEAHYIKNHATQKAEAVFNLRGFHRWCMTGTPIHNEFKDMYSLIKFLKFTPFDDYKNWKKLTSDDTNASEERRNRLVKCLLLRRTKEDTDDDGTPLIKMVKKSLSICYVDLSEAEMKVYEELDTKVKEILNKYLLKSSMTMRSQNLLTLLLRLQQCCGHVSLLGKEAEDTVADSLNDLSMCLSSLNISSASESSESSLDISFSEFQKTNISDPMVRSTKVKKLFEKLDEISKNSDDKDKSVIVSQWTSMLDIIALHLDRECIPYHMIAGKTKPEDRQKSSDDFNCNPNGCKVMLLSLKAGGVGLNLIGGSNLFMMDLHWNPALERQACDRVHRVGQTKQVCIYKFVCNNTIEKKILDLQNSKSALASDALHGGSKVSKGLSMEDFKTLFNVKF